MVYHERWVVFPQDIQRSRVPISHRTKSDLIKYLRLDRYRQGLMYWIENEKYFYARELRETNPTTISFSTITRHDQQPIYSYLICSLGRPLRVYYDQIVKLACFRLGGAAPAHNPHILWDCNLADFILKFMVE